MIFDSTICGNFKHNIGYHIGSSNNNIGSYRIKNQILGTSVPVLVFDSTIWGNFKHNIGYVQITILGLVGSKIGYWTSVGI